MNIREKVARIIEPHAGWNGLKTSINTKWQQEAYAKADAVLALTHCERRMTEDGEWTCDRCKAFWHGELAKTDWRPSECRQSPTITQPGE